MTCTNIYLDQTLLKLLTLLGHTCQYKIIHELIVWPNRFLKYTHKSQGGMHLATQDAHLLNILVFSTCLCFSVSLFLCLSVSLSLCLSVSLSLCLSVSLSLCLSDSLPFAQKSALNQYTQLALSNLCPRP
jgi:hypothetical protein